PEPAEVAHRQRKRPHPRYHQPISRPHLLVIARDDGLGTGVLDRLLDRAAVAHPVIEHRDRRTRAHVSVPLVLGTPRSLGSIATAARNARASALKVASITWCALVPASIVTCSV